MLRHQSLVLLAFLCLAHTASATAWAQGPPQASLDHSGGLNTVAKVLKLDTVRAMLEAGDDPDMRDPHSGATLLHYAILYNKPAIVVLLLAHKANVNATVDARGPETGATPLLYAVVQNELSIARLLIERGANVRATYRSGRTALHIAANGGMTDIIRLLLQNGADPNARDSAGLSPLDEAVSRGFPDVTSLLLESGAQIDDVQLRTGATPLNEAACNGQNAVLQLLLARKADAAIEDKAGFSPIENATRFHHTEAARIILQHSKAELPKNSLAKFLGEAAVKGQEDMVRVLLTNGADVNADSPSGLTAVDVAAAKDQDGIVRLLIANGANVNSRNTDGTMPLYDAALHGHVTTVAILLAHGAQIDAQESQSGTTALYAAASFGREDVAALLLERGADPNICTKRGESPLHAALENGNVRVANRIRQHGGRDLRR
jgi:ankyrin repeat protein